ncbi:MAG: hypothetical protein R3C49_05490 [Planctomycetaceae bacterium]
MSNPYSAPNEVNDAGSQLAPAADVRGMKIITLALIGGVMLFMLISLIITGGALRTQPDLLSWIGIGFFVLNFLTYLTIPGNNRQRLLNQIDRESFGDRSTSEKAELLLPAFRGPHIIGCAVLEGAAFMNLVLYITTEFVGNLAVAAIVVVLLAFNIPTATRVRWWMEERIRELETG